MSTRIGKFGHFAGAFVLTLALMAMGAFIYTVTHTPPTPQKALVSDLEDACFESGVCCVSRKSTTQLLSCVYVGPLKPSAKFKQEYKKEQKIEL